MYAPLMKPSAGCYVAPSNLPAASQVSNLSLDIIDPRLGPSTRYVRLAVPGSSVSTAMAPRPLLLGFHGQGDTGDFLATTHSYESKALAAGFVIAHPFGIDTVQDPGKDTGWNCGTAGDDSTCLPGTTNNSTHSSCARLGRDGRCNWSTCYDDLAFVRQLLKVLEDKFCLDRSRYAVFGQSNGAMFTHHLVTSLPGTFRVAVPCFGTPLLGYLTGARYQLLSASAASAARRTALLSLHGRSDPTIPAQGGRDADGWLYETLERASGAWVAVHGCNATAPAVVVPTPWDASAGSNMRCAVSCRSATNQTSVAFCMYDGGHGYAKNVTASDELVWAFVTAAFNGTPWPPAHATAPPDGEGVQDAPLLEVQAEAVTLRAQAAAGGMLEPDSGLSEDSVRRIRL